MRQRAARWWPRALLVVLLLGTAHVAGRGQFGSVPIGAGGGGMAQLEPERPTPRVYIREPVTGAAAETHRLLNKVIPFPFGNETPLMDFLEHVKRETFEEAPEKVLAIYLDPVGLLEADRTPQSPVLLDLHAATAGRGLELALAQLDLAYTVAPDGLLIITSSDHDTADYDPLPYILDELKALREEVADLREAVGSKTDD